MSKTQETNGANEQIAFSQQIGAKIARKLVKRQDSGQEVWAGLGMTGLVGWSVVVPTLLGTAFGIWLDKHHPATHSWTLTMLITGLLIGCLNAWHWVSSEGGTMGEERKNHDE